MKAGLYQFICCCKVKFVWNIAKGRYEEDLYCPRCSEHIVTVKVRGNRVFIYKYDKGVGYKQCSLLDIMKWTLTLRKN